MVAHKLLPYLELLIKGLMSSGITAKKEGFSYLLSSVAKAHAFGDPGWVLPCPLPGTSDTTSQWGRQVSDRLTLFLCPLVAESPPLCLAPCGYSTVFVE